MEGEPRVSIVSKEIVVPAKPTRRQSYFLSCFDISWKGHYVPTLMFYESTRGILSGQEGGWDGQAIMEKLKSSLAQCLVHYYPCCGRLAPGDRLFIDCNDAGVEFVEALVDIPISHLAQQGFQIQPFFEHLYSKVDCSGDRLYSSPLLSIQATLFLDGGLSLSFTLSHLVGDAHSAWNFMVSWGECARGLPLSLPPLLDRKMLVVPNPSTTEPPWELDPQIEGEVQQEEEEKRHEVALTQNKEESMGTDSSSKGTHMDNSTTTSVGTSSSTKGDNGIVQASLEEELRCIPYVFIFPSSAVKKLKIEEGGIHTSYEVTCAHLWQRLTVARQRPPHEPTHFLVTANCRSRMNPPLPSAFFGNAIVLGISVCTSGKIGSESLHTTASRIHDTIVEITQDRFVKRFMHWLESHDNDLLRTVIPKIPKEGQGVNVGGSSRFPVYEVDFGWGKPVAIRTSYTLSNGETTFFGGHPKASIGDVEIIMGLPSYVLRNLLEDPSFLGKPPCSLYG